MKKYYGSSDMGSVLIGDERWTFAVPNIGGDGKTKILVFDSTEEFNNSEYSLMKFISSVHGRFGIFRYDCDYRKLLRGGMTLDDALCILEGRYGVYNGYYKVAFVKWKD